MLKKFFLTEVLNLGTCTFKLCPLRPYGVEASWKLLPVMANAAIAGLK